MAISKSHGSTRPHGKHTESSKMSSAKVHTEAGSGSRPGKSKHSIATSAPKDMHSQGRKATQPGHHKALK